MKPNDPVIMGVAPGWIFSGVVESVNTTEVTLSPAAYIESVTAPWPEAAKDTKKVSRSSSIERLTIRLAAVLWHSPCSESVARIGASETIKKA